MRIGSTVLLFEQSCVQSYEWNQFRPLGTLQGVMDSLEEYQCDEVAIIRPVRNNDSLALFRQDLKVLQSLKTMTPVSFGGGIRKHEHLDCLSDLPIERIVFSSVFIEKHEKLLYTAKKLFGQQALQCLIPLANISGQVCVYHSSENKYIPIGKLDWKFINEFANEIVIVDIKNEGKENSFNWSLLENIPISFEKIIISGGIGNACIKLAHEYQLASVLIDNKVLHKEYSILGFKNAKNLF